MASIITLTQVVVRVKGDYRFLIMATLYTVPNASIASVVVTVHHYWECSYIRIIVGTHSYGNALHKTYYLCCT